MSANLAELIIPMPSSSAQDRAAQSLAAAEARQIVTAQDYEAAAAELKAIKGKAQEIDESRKTLKRPIDEAAKRIQAFFADPLRFLEKAEGILKGKLAAYDREQERLRAVEQARLDAIARDERLKREAEAREAQRKADEKAAAERKAAEEKRRAEEAERRKAQEAENARLKAARDAAEAQARGDREAREKAEQAAREAQARAVAAEKAARDAAAQADKLEVRAASTEQRGAERAEALQAQAASVVAPIVQADIPKVAGLSSRKNYKAKVTNLMLLVKAVAEGKAPIAYVMANEVVLNKMAKALKEQMDIPGVALEEETVKASGAA